jgi:hypothetical protein
MGNKQKKPVKPQESASDNMFDVIFEFKRMPKELEKMLDNKKLRDANQAQSKASNT